MSQHFESTNADKKNGACYAKYIFMQGQSMELKIRYKQSSCVLPTVILIYHVKHPTKHIRLINRLTKLRFSGLCSFLLD